MREDDSRHFIAYYFSHTSSELSIVDRYITLGLANCLVSFIYDLLECVAE